MPSPIACSGSVVSKIVTKIDGCKTGLRMHHVSCPPLLPYSSSTDFLDPPLNAHRLITHIYLLCCPSCQQNLQHFLHNGGISRGVSPPLFLRHPPPSRPTASNSQSSVVIVKTIPVIQLPCTIQRMHTFRMRKESKECVAICVTIYS